MYLATLGQTIKDKRNELFITAEQLAEKVGVDRTFISKIERHGFLPSLNVLKKIEKTLKIDLYDLYLKEKNPDITRRFPHSLARPPVDVVREFNTLEAEKLILFIHRNVIAKTQIISRKGYELLLEKMAPEKLSNDKLFDQVLEIMKEMKKEKEEYWKGFIQQAKRIEKLIMDSDSDSNL